MKRIALYILAAAAVFAGCSKNNINTTPVDPEDAWMYDATLPVPIRLGANSTTLTKGAQINTLAEMDGKTFGFYAVNSGNDYAVTGNNWSTSVPSMPLEPGVQGVYNAETNRFDFVGGPYFYDQTDWTPYTFYGYYAHVNDMSNPDSDNGLQESVVNSEKIFVRLGIGHTDILWGKAEAGSVTTSSGDLCYGFNAPYLRNGGAQPIMKFQHMTACVSFKVQQVGANNITMNVTELSVDEAPLYANLVIASKNPAEEGKFASKLGEPGKIMLGGLPQQISATSPELGTESLFLYPQESYKVTLSYAYGNFTDSYTVELKPVTKVIDAEGYVTKVDGFLAGYHYTYNFKVYSPEEIVIEAEIEPYKPAFGDDVWEDVDPEEYM